MKIDLHTHSTNSDWEKTPNELLDIAKSKNCEWFVITDHDTFDIWVNKLFKKNWIWSTTWVEITSNCDFLPLWSKWIHITYYSNNISKEITEILNISKTAKSRIETQIEKLSTYFKWNYDDFIDYWIFQWINKSKLNEKHIFLYINSFRENKKKLEIIFWKRYMTWDFIDWFLREIWYDWNIWIWYVRGNKGKPKIEDYASLVDKKSVLAIAHPNFSFNKWGYEENQLEEFENFSQKAKILWINWIEINLKAPEIWVEKTLEIAKKLDMILTFWSDFHAFNTNDWVILENNEFLSDEIIKEIFLRFKEKIEIG